MQFLGNLGVDPWLLLAQIVNFVFLLWVLNKFVYKPLLHRIERDEEKLTQINHMQEQLEEKERKLLIKTKQNTTRMKNRAKKIITEAEEIANSIKHTAQTESETEKKMVITQINKRLAEISHD